MFVVGCGGIGCEVFKCLIGSGVREISLIDLDTIDLTNINRQFIFKKDDVGKSKAEMAAIYLRQHIPDARVTSYHESILQPRRFGPEFFKQFDVVINALDNFTARSYVARMCYLVNVPLVDAGTTGLAGSVALYKKTKKDGLNQEVECYNCYNHAQMTRETIPICTLKNGPRSPEDCIAYAVELLMRAFGLNPQSELIEYPSIDHDNLEESLHDFLVYTYSDAMKTCQKAQNIISPESLYPHDAQEPPSKTSGEDSWLGLKLIDLTTAVTCLYSAAKDFVSILASGTSFSTFDPSCKPMVLLVACLAKLHMHCFGIPDALTPLDVGSIAGSIVPAITFSNAAVAALAVKLALSHNKATDHQCFFFHKSVRCNPISDALRPSNPKCPVCSLPVLTLDLIELTLESAADALLKQGYSLETLIFEQDVWHAPDLSDETLGWGDEEAPKRTVTLYDGAVCIASMRIGSGSESHSKKFHVIITQK
ncbi:Ubiquitin-activating enzyme E1 [Giardia muris]|uniref:NEDD8-activating enzyme E1 catalytic subunit n=1 Tax=Giardia muris TaxID=5742 RepID=A0A4Z1SQC5_GIAMU|nr:Ubiquitin-activating enzyme E1 [Giardia muris]|eukprot:TNJ28052.1 Ubiquitin-activating enzyme E1 [Giardia muris]